MKSFAFSLFVAAAALAAAGRALPARAAVEDSLVEVLVTFQEYDPFLPWQKRQPDQREGYGVVVGDGLVFTTESLVRNQTLVELRRAGRGEKIAARLVMADCRLDCALLRFDTAAPAAGGLTAVPVAETIPPDAQVAIVQLDETRRPQRGDGRVVQIAVKDLPHAPHGALTFSVLTELNVGRAGAPVFHGGKLAGVLIAYSRQDRIGAMLPHNTLARFVADAQTEPYEGVAWAGFVWKELVDPAKRAYLRAPDDGRGVQIMTCLPGTGAAEALRPGDVVLSWDGRDIDNLGFYDDPDYGRLNLAYLIMGRRRPGDKVPVRLLRDGREREADVRLARWSDDDALIPENTARERPEYLLEGGLLLRELTGRYLQSHGPEWMNRVDSRLTSLYLTSRLAPERPGDRIVILAAVLPDPINVGYQHFGNMVVTRVNGRPVSNMRDVFKIAGEDGMLKALTLRTVAVDLVLDAEQMEAANTRLERQYRVSARSYRREPAPGDSR
ncbi:MAG: serine protease [Lentisphaerae bacterium]|nr:serine protease [Lentisphaerota bacterium]